VGRSFSLSTLCISITKYVAKDQAGKTDDNDGASDIGVIIKVGVGVDSRLLARSSDPDSVSVRDEPSGWRGSQALTVGCWWRAGGTEVACKVAGEVEATRGVVELDAFGSEASENRGDTSLIAFVGCGGQVVLSVFVDMGARWTDRHVLSVSLSRNRLTRVVAGTKTRSRCGPRGQCAIRRRLGVNGLSVCLLKDLLSTPDAGHDSVDPDDAPECVSMFVKTKGEKGCYSHMMIMIGDDRGGDVKVILHLLVRHDGGDDQIMFSKRCKAYRVGRYERGRRKGERRSLSRIT
jgi:hypothetical protein